MSSPSFWSDLERAQAYLDFCAERLLDPDDPENLSWWLGQSAGAGSPSELDT
jgi:hypothetical protein